MTKDKKKQLRKQIGINLKKARKSRRLNQEQLGLILDLHQSAVSRIEHGTQSLSAEEYLYLTIKRGFEI